MIENFETNCTAPQDGEEREKIFKTLRDWSENEYQEEMAFLGIDDSNMSWERKKILVILYMLSGVKDKEGWFYIDNANLSEICEVCERTITRAKRDFERLGIIKIKRGYQGSPTRYKFFEKKLNKLPKISKKTPESTLAPLSGKNVTPDTENEIYKSVIDSLLSSCVQVPDKVDNKKIEKKNIFEGGVQYKDKEQYKKQYEYQEQELEQNEYKEQDKYKKQMEELGLILSDNNAKLIENINTIVQTVINTIIQLMTNTNDETIEEFKKLYTSIDNITRVQSEHNTKLDKLFELIEENNKSLNELQVKLQSSSMDNNGNRNGVVQSTIDTNDKVYNTPIESSMVKSESNSKVIEESDNSKDVKESSSKSCCDVQDPSSSNVDDRIMSYQLGLASSNPIKDRAWKREQQKKVDTKTAIKTTVQEINSKEDERNYVLQKLDNLKKNWIEKINTATTEEKLFEYSDESLQQFSDFSKTHIEIQKESKEVFKELQPLFEAKYNQFQTDKETTPKAEACEEKKETTAEPSTANSKSIEVSNVDTSDNKEEQKKLDDELCETASTKKSEEVDIPNDEEEIQLQELKETLKPLLENFNEVGTSEEHESILNEIRKAYTTKGYSQKVLQPFLDFALTYNFYAEKRDIVEAPHQETPSEEPMDEDNWNHTFTDEQAQEALSRLPKPNKRLKEDDYQEEVIDDDMPSDKEVASVVGGYDEENDEIF